MTDEIKEGHEQEPAGKDAFELSDEEYQKARQALLSQQDEATDESDTGAGQAEYASENSAAAAETDDNGQDSPPDEAAQHQPKEAQEELYDIVHRGMAYKVTKEKLVELAQKGFDYDVKVGPHQRFVQLLEADPGAKDVINNYLRDKYGNSPQQPAQAPPQAKKPELKPLAEYDDERAWLEDNVKAIVQSQPPPRAPKPDPIHILSAAIQTHDPTGSKDMIPILAQEAMRLSVADSRFIEESAAKGDLAPFFKFYDYVKGNRQQQSQAQAQPASTQPKATFKMKSGGGQPPRTNSIPQNAWEMPQKDFQSFLAKIKGGYS